MRITLRRCAAVSALLTAAVFTSICAAAPATVLNATTSEPRAFGYQVGDLALSDREWLIAAGEAAAEKMLPALRVAFKKN